MSDLDATIPRPGAKDEPGRRPRLAPIREHIQSIFWTYKDLHTLERHGSLTVPGLRERLHQPSLCLAAAITLNELGRKDLMVVTGRVGVSEFATGSGLAKVGLPSTQDCAR